MEPRKQDSLGADVVRITEGQMDGRVIASVRPIRVVNFTATCLSQVNKLIVCIQRIDTSLHADRRQLFFEPASARRAGILVFPEAFGLGEHAISRAERLAKMGFVALACDLHGDGRVVDDLQEAIGLLQPLLADASRTRARANGALKALTGRSEVDSARVASIGFCFGGTMSIELARAGADVKAIVGFHSGLAASGTKANKDSLKARILVCIGADDPMIPLDQRADFEAEMREAGADWQMHLYGNTVHSFTNPEAAKRDMPEAIRYSPEADARSWASLQAFFAETLR
jgi:dienelactone hydrolase